jgi:transcriptional regulator GlxA family with amidase domain
LRGQPCDPETAEAVFTSGNPLIERAQHLIRENISSRLNLSGLARALSVSERTLFRRFRLVTGITPNEYLQKIRIASAKSSLEFTEDSIATIAACAGYSDRAFFSQVFREHAGMTPSAYRARARKLQPEGLRRSTRVAV